MSPSVGKGRGEEAFTDPLFRCCVFAAAREATRLQWLRRMEETRRHCSGAQKPPTLFTRGYTVPDSVLRVVL